MNFCSKCGVKTYQEYKYCRNCGNLLLRTPMQTPNNYPASTSQAASVQSQTLPSGNTHYAPHPGNIRTTPTSKAARPTTDYTKSNPDGIVEAYPSPKSEKAQKLIGSLCTRIKIESIIWFIIAGFQSIIGTVVFLITPIWPDRLYGLAIIFIAIINACSAFSNLQYIKAIQIEPVRIVEKFKPVSNIVNSLIYNLIFGSFIGIVGCILSFITRNYVMTNEISFKLINDYIYKEKKNKKAI